MSVVDELPSDPDIATGQLVHAWLSGVQYSEHSDFDLERDRVRYSLSDEHDIELQGEQQDAASLRERLTVRWRDQEDDSEHPGPFQLQVEVTGHFHWEVDDPDPEEFQNWLAFNGRYLLRPYARAYIATITAQSSYPALHIFTLELPEPLLNAEAAELEAASEAPERPSAG